MPKRWSPGPNCSPRSSKNPPVVSSIAARIARERLTALLAGGALPKLKTLNIGGNQIGRAAMAVLRKAPLLLGLLLAPASAAPSATGRGCT